MLKAMDYYEENDEDSLIFAFDEDDPDFRNQPKRFEKATKKILGSSDPVFIREDSKTCPISRSHIPSLQDQLENLSLEDIYYYHEQENVPPIHFPDEPDLCLNEVFSVEELKMMYNSCFTCGVSWGDDHVSLDCSECGGYAMKRPCPVCDGNCSSYWTRNIKKSHFVNYAQWEGTCDARKTEDTKSSPMVTNQQSLTKAENKPTDAATIKNQNFS